MGVIDETGRMPQEDVRGVGRGVGASTLHGGNYDMTTNTSDA